MPTRHIALVPESGMNPSDLARVSAALQKQIVRDVGPIWQVSATVDSFPSLEDVPSGYWPIIITFRNIGQEAGIHVDRNGQPYALVEMSPSWSLTASHVSIELITDPFGSRSFSGVSPRPDQGDVEFRAGVCDPCEHPDSAYLISDVLVSDFCTPAYWEPLSKERRSFTGAIQEAYQVLPGGHLSWYDSTKNTWWLRRLSQGVLTDIEVGMADPERGPVREFICRHSHHLQATKMTLDAFDLRVGTTRQRAMRASQSRAYWLRSTLQADHGGRPLALEADVRAELDAARAARNPASQANDYVPVRDVKVEHDRTSDGHTKTQPMVLMGGLPPSLAPPPLTPFPPKVTVRSEPPREERNTLLQGSMGKLTVQSPAVSATQESFRPSAAAPVEVFRSSTIAPEAFRSNTIAPGGFRSSAAEVYSSHTPEELRSQSMAPEGFRSASMASEGFRSATMAPAEGFRSASMAPDAARASSIPPSSLRPSAIPVVTSPSAGRPARLLLVGVAGALIGSFAIASTILLRRSETPAAAAAVGAARALETAITPTPAASAAPAPVAVDSASVAASAAPATDVPLALRSSAAVSKTAKSSPAGALPMVAGRSATPVEGTPRGPSRAIAPKGDEERKASSAGEGAAADEFGGRQ